MVIKTGACRAEGKIKIFIQNFKNSYNQNFKNSYNTTQQGIQHSKF